MLHPSRALLLTVVCWTLGLSLVACDIATPPPPEPETRPGIDESDTANPSPSDDPIDPDYSHDPDQSPDGTGPSAGTEPVLPPVSTAPPVDTAPPADGDSPGLTDPIDPDYTYDPQAIYLMWVDAKNNILCGPTLAGYPLGSAPTVDILTSTEELRARFPEAKDAASGEHPEGIFFSSLADADDDFFADYDLALIRTRGASGSVRYATTVEEGEGGEFTVRVDSLHPDAETMDIVYYAILVPIPRAMGRETVTVVFSDRDQTETVTAAIPGA